MKQDSAKTLREAIGSTLDELGLGAKLKQYDVVNAWPEIVGQQIANVTHAESINDGKLVIRVSRSTWRNELMMLKKELITKINQTMNSEIVKDIIFR
jgi:predicted nucleic acid-binding Zn ribbon protein